MLTLEQPAPEWRGQTNADLLEYTQDLEEALATANAKLRAIAAWARGKGE